LVEKKLDQLSFFTYACWSTIGTNALPLAFMTVVEAIARVNELTAQRLPFFLLVDFDLKTPRVFQPSEAEALGIRFHFPTRPDFSQTAAPPFRFSFSPPDYANYERKFQHVWRALQKGDTYLLNLTACSRIETSWSLPDVYARAVAPYKVFVPGEWVSFSPESFVSIRDGEIATFPMKGTADASDPEALQNLLDNEKELAEHVTVVDLLRNDLSQVAQDVNVVRFRYPTYVQTERHRLIQLSSEIRGRVLPTYQKSLGELFFSLLPAGSVCGAPRARTWQIIREVEGESRGFYTGVAAWYDGVTLDSCVLIRFIEQRNNEFFFRSGGGITLGSRVELEFQELIDKVYVPIA
jgi:para-aminobenzoate synthetase component 1